MSKDRIEEISKIIEHVVDNNSKACGRDLMLTQSPLLPKLNLAEAIQRYVEQECLRARLSERQMFYDLLGNAEGWESRQKARISELQSKLEGEETT